MATELNKETENDVLSTEGESRKQPDKKKETKTETNENGRHAEKEIDIFNFYDESQERPPWWSDEIGQLRKTFVASRKLLKKERKKATKTAEVLSFDMAYAAYQHDKVVLRTAVTHARTRYEKLGGSNSNVETTT